MRSSPLHASKSKPRHSSHQVARDRFFQYIKSLTSDGGARIQLNNHLVVKTQTLRSKGQRPEIVSKLQRWQHGDSEKAISVSRRALDKYDKQHCLTRKISKVQTASISRRSELRLRILVERPSGKVERLKRGPLELEIRKNEQSLIPMQFNTHSDIVTKGMKQCPCETFG